VPARWRKKLFCYEESVRSILEARRKDININSLNSEFNVVWRLSMLRLQKRAAHQAALSRSLEIV
jgi:hypothetical protein